MSTVGSIFTSTGLGGFAPLGQRRNFEVSLNFVHGSVVRQAIGLGAADDPHVGRRSLDALRVLRQFELV